MEIALVTRLLNGTAFDMPSFEDFLRYNDRRIDKVPTRAGGRIILL
jgi:hypothetical protein